MQACSLPYSISKHAPNYESKSTRASIPLDANTARGMAWHHLKLAHAYEYAVGMCGEEAHSTHSTQYSQRALERMGAALALGLRDWHHAISAPEATVIHVTRVVEWEGYKAAVKGGGGQQHDATAAAAGRAPLVPAPISGPTDYSRAGFDILSSSPSESWLGLEWLLQESVSGYPGVQPLCEVRLSLWLAQNYCRKLP